MKKKLMAVTALACMLAAGTVSAQSGQEVMQGGMPGAMGPAMMDGASGYGPGMMGGGMGMGPGMMGGGMGMGPCGQMGGGMMGPGMMGGGMGSGMGMGYGMMGNIAPDDQQKFLDATTDLRKKMHDTQFEYAEAARNPKTTKADLLKKKKELWDIQQKIHEKAWGFMKE